MATAQRKTGQRLEDEIEGIAALAAGPKADALRGLERALKERTAPVAARAAIVVRELGFAELRPALVFAFERFCEDGIKSDPGCRAKVAALETLDRLDLNVPDTLVAATKYVQREPQWGEPADTAVGVRARAILALARWGDSDTPLLAGKLLTDPEWPARQAAADALGIYGERAAASALVVAIAREDEPQVLTACMQSLLRIAPDFAVPELRGALASTSGDARECALFALAQSGRDDALALLLADIEVETNTSRREEAIRVLGLHRTERALAALLTLVAEGPLAAAKAATSALAPRRFDPRSERAPRLPLARTARAPSASSSRRYSTTLPSADARGRSKRAPPMHEQGRGWTGSRWCPLGG